MTRRCNGVVAALLLLATIHPVEGLAGPYEDGDQAFRKKNYEAALRHWHPMAFAGHSGAQLGVATLYYSGHGVMLDYNVAFDWYSKAADQGVPQAQYMLAAMYRDGKGVEQDHARAATLFRKAADHDVQGAQYSLGLMYYTGQGLPVDDGEAYYWLSLAARQQAKDNTQLRSTAAYLRDEVARKLNADQIAELKRRLDERKIVRSP
jgi:TPR repeat protein